MTFQIEDRSLTHVNLDHVGRIEVHDADILHLITGAATSDPMDGLTGVDVVCHDNASCSNIKCHV